MILPVRCLAAREGKENRKEGGQAGQRRQEQKAIQEIGAEVAAEEISVESLDFKI